MNFEHLCKTVAYNIHKLKSKKKTKFYLRYQYEMLLLKKRKLKLGEVAFDIPYVIIYGLIFTSDRLEMRYIRQDTTAEDEMKFENRLKALEWKWDFPNIMAFLIVSFFFFLLFLAILYVCYCNYFPKLAYRDPKYDELVDRSVRMVFLDPTSFFYQITLMANVMLVDDLLALCSFFNMLF